MPDFPDLRSLHEPVHPGLTRSLCGSYVEAAEVCLSRHHMPPTTEFRVACIGHHQNRTLSWSPPSATALRAYNNQDDATRDAAYIVAIAAVEAELDAVAIWRAETRTGADYYVGDREAEDLEGAYRLEVSGSDSGSHTDLRYRLNQKIEQARRGESNLPAYAAVVGFREARVLISELEP